MIPLPYYLLYPVQRLVTSPSGWRQSIGIVSEATMVVSLIAEETLVI